LYDTASTKETVIKVIKWYKKYRDILNADIIHLRRADGRDWDGWMHVNAGLKIKALLMIFNPLQTSITRTIKVPVYYTGIKTAAVVAEKDGKAFSAAVDRNNDIEISFTIKAGSYTWFIIK
jgi:hypothetical protein